MRRKQKTKSNFIDFFLGRKDFGKTSNTCGSLFFFSKLVKTTSKSIKTKENQNPQRMNKRKPIGYKVRHPYHVLKINKLQKENMPKKWIN